MTNPSGDQMIGRTVAQYEILARRGGGGMGVVYEARDTKLGRRVALKFLPPQWSHDEAAKQRFVREAQAASATHHPNICTIHDIATADDGQLFIVMAFYDGETLKQRLAGGMLPVHEALDIATQVADGLAKAHANGVVHRDIKPGNIILTEDGVRIVDFGLATLVDALQLTAPGSTLGTAAYMSPEQARGEEADARADVWAVGVILYEMLAGHVPFRGAYAEAIAYAIRNDPPAPLRQARPEVPEDVEQLVFRALHKDAAIRYQNGRELARALRQARGFTVPVDLRTQAVEVPAAARTRASRGWSRRRVSTIAATILLPLLLAAVWLSWPVPRTPVLVAPVANMTGFEEVEPYRLALTQAIIARLSASRDIRPVPYTRMLPALRQFIDKDDLSRISSNEAIHALAEHSGASIVAVPVLMYEDGAWRARVEFQDAQTTAQAGVPAYESDARVTSLPPVTSYELVAGMAAGIRDRFASIRSRTLDWIASPLQAEGGSADGFFQSHDGALAFEQGLRAYEAFEYARAAEAMATAEEHEPNHPLPAAWRSRIALLTGERQAAVDAASRAVARVTDRTARIDALFTGAVAFEARGDADAAEERYRALVAAFPDQPGWLAELGAFLDRRGDIDRAVTAYHDALAADAAFIRPSLELCRLYNTTRKNQPGLAIEFGEQARSLYAGLSDRLGEAQALLCLADIRRGGEGDQPQHAARHVDAALEIFEAHDATYNLARAFHYAALVRVRGDLPAAITYWERSLAAAESASNTSLQASVASNLGVAHESLGSFAQALDYYQRSYQVSEARRDERRAAYNQANAGALRIWNGIDPDRGFREVENALAVVRRIKDRNFELLCLQALAAFYRSTGQFDAAEQELNRAVAIATELDDTDDLAKLALQRARVHLERGHYGAALATLGGLGEDGSAARRGETDLLVGRAYTLVGDVAAAHAVLERAAAEIEARGERGLLPSLHLAIGQLALDAGKQEDARGAFVRSADLWRDDLPDRASVEARAYIGWMDAERGRRGEGRALVERSLAQAQRMRDAALEARCRVFLARIATLAGRHDEAVAALAGAPIDRVGLEHQAVIHGWLSRSRAAAGDTAGSRRDREAAHRALTALLEHTPEQYRSRITGRPAIMAVAPAAI